METDLIRLALFIAGAVVVLGIFLWDRYKRHQRVMAMRQAEEHEDGIEVPSVDNGAPSEPDNIGRELDALGQMVSGRRPSFAAEPPEVPSEAPPETAELEPEAAPAAAQPAEPIKIVQINIVAKRGFKFPGADVLRAVRDTEMEFGDMDIFHRHEGEGERRQPVFSMANMVEPGTFELETMDTMQTPGVTLFMRLPGPRDGIAAFSDMLFTAQRIATDLDGELQDASHSSLTKQTVEHIRAEILEFRRRMQIQQVKA